MNNKPRTKAGGRQEPVVKSSAFYKAKNYLLAIAINDYEYESPLYNCVKDAQDLIELLTEEFEFEREDVTFVCGGSYDKKYADLVAKPSPKVQLKILHEDWRKIKRLVGAAGVFKRARAVNTAMQTVETMLLSGYGPLHEPQEKARFLKKLQHLKQAIDKKAADASDATSIHDIAQQVSRLRDHIEFPHHPATRSTIFNTLSDLGDKIRAHRAANEDEKVNVVLFYSGHGWFDKDLEQGYWIPADAGPKDYSKYVSNSTIRDFLTSFGAHHLLLVADSCFSGSLFASGSTKSVKNNRLEKDPSRWGITAGRNEVVSDGKEGDNSPFARSILAELRKAENISVQDLGSKVLEVVAADEQQTPRSESLRVPGHEGGQFVFRKKANAVKHLNAGKLLLDLAEFKPEYERYRAAVKQFEMAFRLTKKNQERIEIAWWKSHALLKAGAFEEAIQFIESASGEVPELDQDLNLKMLLGFGNYLALRQTDAGKAIERLYENALRTFEDICDGHDNLSDTPLPVAMIDSVLASKRRIKLLAVGINKYQHQDPLKGCVEDARALEEALTQLFGEKLDSEILLDKEATRSTVLKKFEMLTKAAGEHDIIFVFLSGWAHKDTVNEGETPFFLPVNAKTIDDSIKNAISCEELHRTMTKLQERARFAAIIADTNPNPVLERLAGTGEYATFMSARSGQQAHEIDGRGLFSRAFVRCLVEGPLMFTFQKQVHLRMRELADHIGQTPVFSRDEEFLYEALVADSGFQTLISSVFGPPQQLSEKAVESVATVLEKQKLDLAAMDVLRIARLFHKNDAHQRALTYYEMFLTSSTDDPKDGGDPGYADLRLWKVLLEMAQSAMAVGLPEKARSALDRCLSESKEIPAAIRRKIEQFRKTALKAANSEGHALLVALGEYMENSNIAGVKAAVKEAEAWKEVLQGWGYKEENIILLKNADATRVNIRKRFRQLARHAKNKPAFFFYAGAGSESVANNSEAILPFDSYREERFQDQPTKKPADPILLSDLAAWSKDARHLTVVLDCGFKSDGPRYSRPAAEAISSRRRSMDAEQDVPEMSTASEAVEDNGQLKFPFGNLMIVPGSFEHNPSEPEPICYEYGPDKSSVLSQRLMTHFQQNATRNIEEVLSVLTQRSTTQNSGG